MIWVFGSSAALLYSTKFGEVVLKAVVSEGGDGLLEVITDRKIDYLLVQKMCLICSVNPLRSLPVCQRRGQKSGLQVSEL